jgi:ATP-dependent protease ClpP protease subunit
MRAPKVILVYLFPVWALFIGLACFQLPRIKATTNVDAQASHRPVMIEIGEIDDGQVAGALFKISKHVGHGDKNITLRINSDGGSVFAGMEFIQNVEEYKKQGVKFTCIVDHRAISMGFVILQAVCDTRLATERSFFLAHNGSLQTGGTTEEIEQGLEILEAIHDGMARICAKRIGIPVEEYKKKLKDKRSWILNAHEALKANVIDGLVAPLELPSLEP